MFNIATNAYGRMSDLVGFTRKIKKSTLYDFQSGIGEGTATVNTVWHSIVEFDVPLDIV